MKRLLLSIMVMAVLASCGKDNKVNSDLGANGNAYNTTNQLLAGNQAAQELIARINNPASFGQGQTSGPAGTTTWNALLATNPSATFRYTNGYSIVSTVRNSDVVIANKQSQLITLLNSATAVSGVSPVYYVTANNGVIYAIDTRYAIQMNPSALKSGNSSIYFLDLI